MTPQEWLELLTARMEARRPYIALMRSYTGGNAPLPEMGQNLRASWEAFQRKSRSNWGGYVVEALMSRIVFSTVVVGGSVSSPEATRAANIMMMNRLATAFPACIQDSLETGYGYMVVGTKGGEAVVTPEKPEFVIVAQNELHPWKADAALKIWRHPYDGFDYALLWIPGKRLKYKRQSRVNGAIMRTTSLIQDSRGGWGDSIAEDDYNGPVPVFELEGEVGKASTDRIDYLGGLSVIDRHTDLIDRINLGVLQRIVTTSMQAFRQRALMTKEGSGGLPDKDADGEDIDWAAVFEPAPGALWEVPEQVLSIWESQQADVSGLLNAVKDDVRELGALTGATMPGITSDSANQSAEGARSGKEGLAAKANKVLTRAVPMLNGVILAALRSEGVAQPGVIEVKFEPTDRVTLAEKADAATKLKSTGVSLPIIERDILGWSPEVIAEDEKNRRKEASQQMLTRLASTPPPAPGQAPSQTPMMAQQSA